MKIVSEANAGVLEILKKFKKNAETSRLLHYVVEETVDNGILLFNLLTRELLFLTEEEYKDLHNIPYLKERWFLVPEQTKEKELVGLVRWVLRTQQKKAKAITGYTIFTTMDCNARCFYCFEHGRARTPMSDETAYKTAKYIYEHCGGEKVKITWFGGEPLYNQNAMEIICSELQRLGVSFTSTAVSNGYLFDNKTVEKAVKEWNLKQVQITLDGTEQVYNKIKAYIYKDTNPYQIVMDNIGHLLDAGVFVQIRLNMDLKNAENLLALVDEISGRFPNRQNIGIYARHIFKGNVPLADSHTEDEWVTYEQALQRINTRIEEKGLALKRGIKKHVRIHYCMADSGSSVTIVPSGDIGLCEHYSESEFIGHIDSDQFDAEMIKSWKQTIPEIPECDTCFYYPECILLKKCTNCSVCFSQERTRRLSETKLSMRNEYQRWLCKTDAEELDDSIC